MKIFEKMAKEIQLFAKIHEKIIKMVHLFTIFLQKNLYSGFPKVCFLRVFGWSSQKRHKKNKNSRICISFVANSKTAEFELEKSGPPWLTVVN